MNVAILGTGYVGLTTGACLAYLGHKVVLRGRGSRKIEMLWSGARCLSSNPILREVVADASRESALHHRISPGDPYRAGDFYRRGHAAGAREALRICVTWSRPRAASASIWARTSPSS